MASPKKMTVFTGTLDPILSQIMQALAMAKPEERIGYINLARSLNDLTFRMKTPAGKVIDFLYDEKK